MAMTRLRLVPTDHIKVRYRDGHRTIVQTLPCEYGYST